MKTNNLLDKEEKDNDIEVIKYRGILGSLLYLINSRIYIIHHV